MSNLFLDLDSSDTFDTALERMEEYGVGSISLPDAKPRSGGSAQQDG